MTRNPYAQYGQSEQDNPYAQYRRRQPVNDRMSALAAFGSGVGDAVSFGFGDELQGLVFGEQARDAARMRQEQARVDEPGWFLGGQIAGSLAGGGAANLGVRGALGAGRLASAARNIGPLSRIGIGAAVGGLGGAAYGAGDAREGNRLQGAGESFLPGVAFGAVGQGAGELIGRVGGAVQRSLSPEARSGRMMAEVIDRFGPPSSTPEQAEAQVLQALRDAPDNAMVGDVVPGFSNLTRGAGVRPSRQREELRQAFDRRNESMGLWARGRLAQDFGADDVSVSLPRLQAEQRAAAQPLYASAYSQRVQNVRPRVREMLALDARLDSNNQIFTQAARVARDDFILETGIQNPTREQLEASPRYWHRLLEASENRLGDLLAAARTGATGSLRGTRAARETIRVRRMNNEIRAMLGDDFRRAQDVWAGSARSQRAQELGYEAVQPGVNSLRLLEVEREMRRMSAGELRNFRAAVAGKLQDMLENAETGTGRADILRVISRSAGQRRLLNRLFGEENIDRFLGAIDEQRALFRASVESGIGVNSHTAPLWAAYESQQALTRPTGVRDAIFRLLTRDASDRFDENVSNEILQTAGLNANQVANEVAKAGSFSNWAGGRGLLSRAVRERQRMLQQRPDALMGALGMGLYAPTVGAGVGYYGLGQ